jgi:hypothetical protein
MQHAPQTEMDHKVPEIRARMRSWPLSGWRHANRETWEHVADLSVANLLGRGCIQWSLATGIRGNKVAGDLAANAARDVERCWEEQRGAGRPGNRETWKQGNRDTGIQGKMGAWLCGRTVFCRPPRLHGYRGTWIRGNREPGCRVIPRSQASVLEVSANRKVAGAQVSMETLEPGNVENGQLGCQAAGHTNKACQTSASEPWRPGNRGAGITGNMWRCRTPMR